MHIFSCLKKFIARRKTPEKNFEQFLSGIKHNWEIEKSLNCFTMDKVWVRTDGRNIGYIEGIVFSLDKKTVVIGHIATETENKRKGDGTYIARYFAKKIRDLYGTKTVIFRQTRNYEDGYELFFKSLGAKASYINGITSVPTFSCQRIVSQ
ncbi:hypothetical protein ACO0K9_14295 [Undibacterium sp. Ji50W]|uniref:hypothetical protein n=1 Tax=Undibacterium sp. Ji50W TaxID=3413041 RepID=UPI003BF0EBC3